ncbi:phospholipid-transporting ATPase IK isoform X2 [Xenopus laevis]|uniref:Phospholipid-transporting ATPase n=1 Tax=Xenopus laevis TaxID=8355 RepID=A0A8J1KJK4_XENLA|nr:phospholipid-transporting ATPase IK isoform X2 [Xenopus laevis]
MNQKQNQDEEDSQFEAKSGCTWEVRANNRIFNSSVEKKTWLFCKKKKYADNSITTSKYNILTFIPLNLFEQFHRMANLYFLFIIILQTIPAISTLPWFAIMMPLLVLLVIRGIRDLIDDIARNNNDKAINNRPCEILKGQSFCMEKWKDIQTGDIVRLKKNDFVPADLFLLKSSEPNSLCFVETADIDGETNLKFKQALMVTHQGLSAEESLSNFVGKVTCEEPNSNMHTFIGTLEWNGETYSLDNDCILLRGCKIRNTEACYGLVIYAGFDSKIMKNGGKVRVKKTKLEKMMNSLVIIIFGMLIVCAAILAIIAGYWSTWFKEKHSYIPPLAEKDTPAYSAFLVFWGYVILLSTIVPMSMYINLELIHLLHNKFINWDEGMYSAEKNTAANARSSSLNYVLGQVEYVFSDKTGTLTQNIMTFKKCCINGRTYGTGSKDEENIKVVNFSWNKYADKNFQFYDQSLIDMVCENKDGTYREFFRVLALCHTVMAERDGEIVYKAASPDEEALVTAARNVGYVFLSRTQETMTVNELGVERTYRVLALLDFSSVRKRMSILVEDPDGRIKLYTKGADDVIMRRLNSECSSYEITEKALAMFAHDTLRTLCVAYKDVDISMYKSWSKRYHQARVTLQNRAVQLERVYEEMETDLQLLGATAIEDKLQDKVPETIQLLKDGNMKVWVLTGDKQETAINIGFSCRLLSDDMEILIEEQISDILDEYWEHNNNLSGSGQDLVNCDSFKKHRTSLQGRKMALVVSGDFLGRILGTTIQKQNKHSIFQKCCNWKRYRNKEEDNLKEWAFVDLASQCQTVICCRVTPKQKSMVVKLVKKHKNATTLAIGDGANDVNMIKTADIGVGISGLEGTQAVQSSDFSIAQFFFLQRLLFIHGRWSYLRITKYFKYFFYKTFANVLGHVWFGCFNGFSALTLYDSWYISLYSVTFTCFPVLSLAVLEQDVTAEVSLQSPALYRVGQSGSLFTYKTFLITFIKGITTSLSTFFISFGAFRDTAGPDGICDYQAFAVTTATTVILSVTIEIIFEISYWTRLSVIAVVISPLLYFLSSFTSQSFPLFTFQPTMFQFPGASRNTLSHGYIWLTIILGVVISILPSLVVIFLNKVMSHNRIYNNMCSKADTNSASNTIALGMTFKKGALHRRSSYAFSHKEGYADLISNGTSLHKAKPKDS